MKPHLLSLAALAGSLASLHAQSFFKPTPIYLTPAWRGNAGTEFSHWDVFYSPYNGINFPDFDAPNGEGALASEVGATPPANANPSDPFAFWDAANPTLKQVLEPGAFIIGAGTAGNIYSFDAATGYELADATPFTPGTVVMQWQTDGTLIDFDTLRLVTQGGAQLTPTNIITEYKSSGSSFGGTINRTAAQWNLTGLGVSSYTIKFQSAGSSNSLQELFLDTAPTYSEAVPSARIWSAASGNWSIAANWSGGSVGPVGGNIVFASGNSANVDGGTREIGELKLNAPGGFSIGATGGGILKVNSGITAKPASDASYTISAPYRIGSFNLIEAGSGAVITISGPVSGTSGYLKLGPGTLRLTANNTFTGAVALDGGTLEVSGTNAYSGATSVISGNFILKGAAPNAAAGTLGNASSAVVIGGGDGAALLVDGAFNVGRAFTILNGDDSKTIGGQNTGAGATFSGLLTLQSNAGAFSLHAENAADRVTFTGGISGGNQALTLTKTGAGRVVLSGSNKSYVSDTVVSAGTLEIAAGTQLTGTREVTVASGANLIVRGSFGSNGLLALNIGAGGKVQLGGAAPAEAVSFDESAMLDQGVTVTPVPEPAASLLVFSGALLCLRRRRRTRAAFSAALLSLFAMICTGTADLPPLPQPATSFGAAIDNGWVYVYGGNTGKAHEFHRECIKGDYFRLKVPAGTEWETLPGEAPLLGAAMAAKDGWIYRVGGMEARNAKGAKNDLHSTATALRYSPATRRWEPLPNLPDARSSHDVAIFGETLFVGGGWKLTGGGDGADSEGDWHETLLSLDLRNIEGGWQLQPQPFKRRALAVVAHGDRIWFLGGMDGEDEPSREVDWFVPATGKWGKGPQLPEGSMAGFGMAACSADGKLLASPLSGKVFALSADGGSWEPLTQLAQPRFFHRLLPTADGRVVAVGGSNRKGQIREPELLSLEKKVEVEKPATSSLPAPSTAAKSPSEPTTTTPWPQWRGSNRDGISQETAWRKDWPAEGPRVLWRAQVGAGVSSCVVAGGRVIAHGNDGDGTDRVVALDAATGTELWGFAFPCKATAHEMPIVPNGPAATPTIAGGSVFALSREGDLVCLDLASGQLAWRKNLASDLGGKRPVYGYAQSPLVDRGRIYLDLGAEQGKTGSSAALDAATGNVLWSSGTGEAGYSSARIFEREGRPLLAMLKGEAFNILDPADGRLVWSHSTTSRDFTNSLTPVFVGHRVLVSNTSEPLARLLDWDSGSVSDSREIWSNQQFALLFNNPILHEGCLFAFNEKRRGRSEFTCLDAETGVARWVSEAVPIGTFIFADKHWIFLSREGEVVLAPASAAKLAVSARFKALEGKCYATPALADRRLFVRDNAGVLAAFDLR